VEESNAVLKSEIQGSLEVTESRASSPILTHPNELLLMIFGTSWMEPVDTVSDPGDPYEHIPSLRRVCHRFRTLTNTMPFRLDDGFEFTLLYPERTRLYPGLSNSRLVALLSDPHLADVLSHKQTWFFFSYNTLVVVMDLIPAFCERVTRLRLGSSASGYNIYKRYSDMGFSNPRLIFFFSEDYFRNCFRALARLPNLCYLTLERIPHRVEHSDIYHAAPDLEVLHLSRSMITIRESIEWFKNLKTLRLDEPYSQGLTPRIQLPSADSLQVLDLGQYCLFDFSSLPPFSQLSTISLQRLDKRSRQALHLAKLNIKHFSLVLRPIWVDRYRVDANDIIHMLSSSSFRNLEEFSFIFDAKYKMCRDDQWLRQEDSHFRLFRFMSNLRSLKILNLSIPFRSTCFCHLSFLCNVSLVEWIGTLGDLLTTNVEEMQSIVRQEIESTFRGARRKPRCDFATNKWRAEQFGSTPLGLLTCSMGSGSE
jgi:hypothetical protein